MRRRQQIQVFLVTILFILIYFQLYLKIQEPKSDHPHPKLEASSPLTSSKTFEKPSFHNWIEPNNYQNVTTQLSSQKFVQLQREIMEQRGVYQQPRVVFYQIRYIGYGNRIYSLLSALMVAVLTDSALLVDWPTIDSYIDSPLHKVFQKFNDKSLFDLNQKDPPICYIKSITSNTWAYKKSLNVFPTVKIPNCIRFHVSGITPYFFDLAGNLNYAKKLVQSGFVNAETVERAQQSLNDPKASESQKLEDLLRIGFEFGGHALTNYWIHKPLISEKVDEFVRRNFAQSFVIGFQMRFEYLYLDEIEIFVLCALEIEAKNKKRIGTQLVKWFISTDRTDLAENLVKKYSSRVLTGEGKVGHVAEMNGTYERALFDIEVLSRCDETILTGGSTFGFIGMMKRQKRPFFVEGMRNASKCELFEFFAPARTPENDAIF